MPNYIIVGKYRYSVGVFKEWDTEGDIGEDPDAYVNKLYEVCRELN